jgi:peptide chain release factor 1
MLDKLEGIKDRFFEVERYLGNPEIFQDRKAYQSYSKEHSELSKLMDRIRAYEKVVKERQESKSLLEDGDPEIKEMAKTELEHLTLEKSRLEDELRQLLVPKDPLDEKNVIIEIRAGTGGEEAGLFAGDLFRMYDKYAEKNNWTVEVLNHHATGIGGLKEIIAMISGKGAYSRLKFESGTHRVQRVPTTETQGRIHTSAVTVAVLPEAEDVELNIDPSDLKIDVYRSTGPGGQSVNTTDSAVRITHLPTGVVATCQDQKSQLKNKNKAMKVLRARILDDMIAKQAAERSQARKGQIGTGDRSGRIRTYNFPQGRVTDHRIGLSLYKLEEILQGHIDEIIEELAADYQAQAIQNAEADKNYEAAMDHTKTA